MNTAASAVIGLTVGLVLTFALAEVAKRRRPAEDAEPVDS